MGVVVLSHSMLCVPLPRVMTCAFLHELQSEAIGILQKCFVSRHLTTYLFSFKL